MSDQVDDRHSGLDGFRRRHQSIGFRLLLLIVVLGLLLLMLVGLGAALVGAPSLKLKVIGAGVQQVSVPAVPALAELQAERQRALAFLATPSADTTALHEQEARTSQGLQAMQTAAGSALSGAPPEIFYRLTVFAGLLGQLQQQRSMVDARSASAAHIFRYYNSVLDAATGLFDAQARLVPDAPITQSAIAAVNVWRATDDMSRAGSLAASALANGSFASQEYQQFHRLVGAYHADLDTTAPYLEPDAQAEYTTMVNGPEFQQLSAIEDTLIARGPDPHKPALPFPVLADRWLALTSTVSQQLVKLTIRQANDIAARAAETGASTFARTAWILGSALVVVIGTAIVGSWFAWRVSRRLKRLAHGMHRMSTDLVPGLVRSLEDCQEVDIDACVELLDDQPDEIGGAASRFRDAVIADLHATEREIQARQREILLREGTTRLFRELAHRIEVTVSRLLEILLEAQAKEQNSYVLRLLFTVDHEVVGIRRISHNMIVLGGDQPQGSGDAPVPLHHILQGAASETTPPGRSDQAHQLQRFELQNIPDVAVQPFRAHQIAHALSELMDNAVQFSRRDSTIRVIGERTVHGVAIEIADAGIGMTGDALHGGNEIMRNPPEFDEMVREDAVRHLGFFVVAHLARDLNVNVVLKTSPWEGLSAIVNLPRELLVFPEPEHDDHGDADGNQACAPSRSPWFSGEDTAWTGVPIHGGDTTAHMDTATAQPVSTAVLAAPPDRARPAGPRHAQVSAPAGPQEGVSTQTGPPLARRRPGATLQTHARSADAPTTVTPLTDIDLDYSARQLSQFAWGSEQGRQDAEAAKSDPAHGPAWPSDDESTC